MKVKKKKKEKAAVRGRQQKASTSANPVYSLWVGSSWDSSRAHTEQGKAQAYGAAGSQDALRVGLVQRQHYDVHKLSAAS